MTRLRILGLGSLVLLPFAVACGGTAVIDGDDGSGASGGTAGRGGDDGTGGTGTGPGPQPLVPDGLAFDRNGSWELQVVSFPISCQNPDPPTPACNFFDITITLSVASLSDGQIFSEGSSLGDSYFSAAEGTGFDCSFGGGGGGLFGDVTIVDMQADRIVVELGPSWDLFSSSLAIAGQYTLAICS